MTTNFKFYLSLFVGIVDDKMKFIDVYIGVPGRVHDARVFQNSPIFTKIDERGFLISGGHIIGDCGYKNTSTLITPYRNTNHLTDVKKYTIRLQVVCDKLLTGHMVIGKTNLKFWKTLKVLRTTICNDHYRSPGFFVQFHYYVWN